MFEMQFYLVASLLVNAILFFLANVFWRRKQQACSDANLAKEKNTELQLQLKATQTELQAERRILEWQSNAQVQLSEQFEALSHKVLAQTQQRQQRGVQQLLQPLERQVSDFRQRLEVLQNQHTGQQAELREHLHQLQKMHNSMHQDAIELTRALKGESATQGAWGEMILEKLLENSGLQKEREYRVQPNYHEEGRNQRPDAVVYLPGQRDIIIDSKVSLLAYEQYVNAANATERQKAIRAHIASVRQHIKDLSGKAYHQIKQIHSVDAVLLFIPIEGAYAAAIQHQPSLYEEAFKQNIILSSPSSLMLALKTVHYLWRSEQQNKNTMEIASRGGKICDQIALVNEALLDLGNRLKQAERAWTLTRTRMTEGQGSLLRQAQQLQELGAITKKSIPKN